MEHSRVIRSAFVIGGFTLMSRALGLVRDFLTAGFFGTSLAMSAFVVAFRVPNLFRALFGEGALSSAFVPVFMKCRHEQGDEQAWLLARKVITVVGSCLLVIVLAGTGLITFVMQRPDLSSKTALILPLARIMLPYMMFICLAALSMAILNSYHQFALPASTPSLLNLTWIGFVLWIVPRIGGSLEQQIFGVAWGVFCAGLLQLAIQVPALVHYGWRPGLAWDFSDERVVRVFKLMGPAALGLAVYQVNAMVDSLLAVWVGSWAPASLFYAERLLYFPQGILATALSTVLLPVLSGHAARADHPRIAATLNHSLRTLLFVMTPAAVGLFIFSHPLVQMIFEWNRFTPESTRLTARALAFYAPGLLVFCLGKVFVPAFYALQDTRTPVRIGLYSVAINFTLNIVFILTWPLYYKHAGLALATVISEGFNGITLAVLLRRRLGPLGFRTIAGAVARALAASCVMAVAALLIHHRITAFLAAPVGGPDKAVQIGSTLIAIAAGLLVYLATARLMKAEELGYVVQALKSRRRRRVEEEPA